MDWNKILSGRFILTIISGAVLFMFGMKSIPLDFNEKIAEKVLNLIEMIVMFYFLKSAVISEQQPKNSDVSITKTETVSVTPKTEEIK